jgi:hypothetical protein
MLLGQAGRHTVVPKRAAKPWGAPSTMAHAHHAPPFRAQCQSMAASKQAGTGMTADPHCRYVGEDVRDNVVASWSGRVAKHRLDSRRRQR